MQADLGKYDKMEKLQGDLVYKSRDDRVLERLIKNERPVQVPQGGATGKDMVIDSQSKLLGKDDMGRFAVKFEE